MNLILYHPKTDHEKFYSHFWIPYSILSIASICEENGIHVILIDANAAETDIGYIKNKLLGCICVGISCMTGHQIKDGLNFAKIIRDTNSDIPIIWGGAHPTLFPQETLKNKYVDFIIQGQGEKRLFLLVDALRSNKLGPYNIAGVGEKVNGISYINKEYQLEDKKYFPGYKWELLNLSSYIRNDKNISERTLNYISSQGCPFTCGFCSEVGLYNGKWTSFSSDRVIDDIYYLVKHYNVNGMKFYDANYFVNTKRVINISTNIIPLNIRWAASAHPKNLLSLSNNDWDVLIKSGCRRLLIGIESGSQVIVNKINKNFNITDAIPLAKKIAKTGIIGSFTFIVGFPGNYDKDEIQKTLKLARALKDISSLHECKIHFYAPYPGTPLWNESLQSGFIPPDTLEKWADFDYYYIETPWVDQYLEEEIHLFNKENCPYVHL